MFQIQFYILLCLYVCNHCNHLNLKLPCFLLQTTVNELYAFLMTISSDSNNYHSYLQFSILNPSLNVFTCNCLARAQIIQ